MLCDAVIQSKYRLTHFSYFIYVHRNLANRGESCVDSKINIVRVGSDCLVFQFANGKNAQYGDDHVVRANPENPAVCPVLAFSKYLATFPHNSGRNPILFEGKSQYEKYSNFLHRACKEYRDDLALIGLPEDLGKHSSRKGVNDA